MATDPSSSRSDEESTETPISTAGSPPARGLTRASAAWVATGAALLLLILLIVFILQIPRRLRFIFLECPARSPSEWPC